MSSTRQRTVIAAFLISILLMSTSFAGDREGRRAKRKENRQARNAERKAEQRQMKNEIKACSDRVCKCEVRKTYHAKRIAKLKEHLAKMEAKHSEWDCSKKAEKK